MLTKMGDLFGDMLFNPTLGKWCMRLWIAAILIMLAVVLIFLLIGLAAKVGWILALVLAALIMMGLMSIYTAFVYVAVHLE